jgi:hypothetical protein
MLAGIGQQWLQPVWPAGYSKKTKATSWKGLIFRFKGGCGIGYKNIINVEILGMAGAINKNLVLIQSFNHEARKGFAC